MKANRQDTTLRLQILVFTSLKMPGKYEHFILKRFSWVKDYEVKLKQFLQKTQGKYRPTMHKDDTILQLTVPYDETKKINHFDELYIAMEEAGLFDDWRLKGNKVDDDIVYESDFEPY
ncbi:Ff.00g077920.m01.CDS01 [Fusarium sp. VM40]|nr:Ff.00g077920.m01.CDS01 [Fusarium sp. VM40]